MKIVQMFYFGGFFIGSLPCRLNKGSIIFFFLLAIAFSFS